MGTAAKCGVLELCRLAVWDRDLGVKAIWTGRVALPQHGGVLVDKSCLFWPQSWAGQPEGLMGRVSFLQNATRVGCGEDAGGPGATAAS